MKGKREWAANQNRKIKKLVGKLRELSNKLGNAALFAAKSAKFDDKEKMKEEAKECVAIGRAKKKKKKR